MLRARNFVSSSLAFTLVMMSCLRDLGIVFGNLQQFG